MGNMDSIGSNSRASERLYLAGLFTRFMSEVSEQTALQLRRDSAKKTLEQKTAAYNKAQVMHKEFPSAEESTKASKERAQKEFEKVEKELIKKREASMKLSEEISEIVYPEEEPSDSDRHVAGKIKNLEDKLSQYHADSELIKNKQQQLDQLYSTLMTEKDKRMIIDSIGNEFSSVRQEVSAHAAKTSTLEAEIAQLKQSQAATDLRSSFEELSLRINGLEQRKPSEDTVGLKSIIDTLSFRVDELQHTSLLGAELEPRNLDEDTTGLRSTMSSLSSRIDNLEAIKLELDKTVETINSNLALQSAAINDRSEMQGVHSSINALSRSEGEVRTGFAKLQSQVQALGKDLRTIRMVERGRRPSDVGVRDTNGLSKELRIAIHDEIRAQQEAVDVVLDEKFGNIDGQLGDLQEQLKPLETQLAEVDSSLNSFRNQYAAQIDRIAIDLDNVRGDINSTREEINALKQNDIHSLQLAYTNLDYRMNNLSTEHMARQILGQLDAHIRGGEKNITTIELRMQELERRAANGEGSTMSRRDVEESLRKVRKDLTDAVDEHLDKFKSMFVDLNRDLVTEQMQLRTEVDTNHSKWQNVKVDVEASKTNIAEAMGSLRNEVDALTSKTQSLQEDLNASKIDFTEATKSLRAEVDGIGPTLQTVQDDLGATKASCQEATAALKVEIAKATKANSPEKRRIDSPGPIKTNGHKRKRARRSISDSDDDA
jgi:chromosome segregation ATPase